MLVYKFLHSSLLLVTFYIHLHGLKADETEFPTVSLPNGNRLKGIKLTSFYNDRPYYEFRKIPYAKAPIGELRFKPTFLLNENWGSEAKDATEFGSVCPQLDPWFDPDEAEDGSHEELPVLGNEDCLFVNVATPNLIPPSPLPVLVWFHGGNFQSESGQDYGPAKLLDYDIIVVTFNHRLGPFGFLNTEDGNIQGNMGLKDQTILLQWVKENIASFGGDVNRVTAAGTNSGAVSVHLHMLSDMSRGLFNRAIIQSGTGIAPWVLMRDGKENAEKIAKHLKCGNNTDLTTCFFRTDAVTIIQKMTKMTEWYLDPLVPFGPSVELLGDMSERFLPRNPFSILADGNYWAKDIPVVMGVNSHEGLLHAMDIGHNGMLRRVFNLEWFGSAPISLYYKKTALDPRSVSQAVRHFYFPSPNDDKLNGSVKLIDKDYLFDNLTNLYSDRHFFVPLHHSAKLMGKSNELYLYWFDFVSQQSIHGLYGYNSSQIVGPSHYDQLQYLFVTPYFNQTQGDDIIKFEKQFLTGFYKFIKDGSPFRNDWIQVTKEMTEGTVPLLYNRIGKPSDAPQIIEKFTSRVEFWNSQLLMEYEKGSFVDDLMKQQDSIQETKKDEL